IRARSRPRWCVCRISRKSRFRSTSSSWSSSTTASPKPDSFELRNAHHWWAFFSCLSPCPAVCLPFFCRGETSDEKSSRVERALLYRLRRVDRDDGPADGRRGGYPGDV